MKLRNVTVADIPDTLTPDPKASQSLRVSFVLEFAGGVEPDTAITMDALLALRQYLEEWEQDLDLSAEEKVQALREERAAIREAVLSFPDPSPEDPPVTSAASLLSSNYDEPESAP